MVKHALLVGWLTLGSAGCQLFGTHAIPPDGGDGGGDSGAAGDGGPDAAPDAAACQPGDRDGDGVTDCAEAADGDPFTDPVVFNGLLAVIGDRPEVTGSCSNLTDYDEMNGHFQGATRMNVRAGWEFDTDADAYNDPSYGFSPNWGSAPSERFSVRFTGRVNLRQGGMHCFSIDIGATGTGIVSGKNMCAQVYVSSSSGMRRLIESGYQAESATANVACLMLPAGDYPFDIVFWYFNIFERAKLAVRWCAGGSSMCTPSQPLTTAMLGAP